MKWIAPLIIASQLFAAQIPDHDIHRGIALSLSGRYDAALELFNTLKRRDPSSPAGSFFCAALWQTRMMDFETRKWEPLFFDEIERSEKLARSRLKEKEDDLMARFYLGAALSYKSFQLARSKRYGAAVRAAVISLHELGKIARADSSFCDVYLGIGSYIYWRSRLTRRFPKLPFIPDDRASGIEMIERASECGRYTGWAALSNLAWIHIEEGEYNAAIDCAEKGLELFPDSRFFLWPLGDALFEAGRYPEATETYTILLHSVMSERENNRYNEITLLYKLARCRAAMKQWTAARSLCRRTLEIEADDEVRARSREKQKEARELLSDLSEKEP